MDDLLIVLLDLAVPVFAASSMIAIGFRFSTREVMAPLRDVGGVIRILVANFVLVPLLVFLLVRVVSLDLPFRIGLFLVASAAGAPFLVQLVRLAGGDLAATAGMLVLLLLATLVYLPVVVPLAFPEANVSAGAIAMPLFMTMLLPLAAGHFVEARFEKWARRLLPVATKISSGALVVLIVAMFLVHFGTIVEVFGTGAILVSILVIAGAFGIGFLLGGRRAESRIAMSLGTAQRNIAAATVVATEGFENPEILAMVVVFSLAASAMLFPVAWFWGRARGRRNENGS